MCGRRDWRLAGLSSALAFPLDLGARPLCIRKPATQRAGAGACVAVQRASGRSCLSHGAGGGALDTSAEVW